MAQVRKELAQHYPAQEAQKRAICSGIAVNLWRAMSRGEVRQGPELADFLRELFQRLREARRVGDHLRAWCSWGGWTVRTLVNERAAYDQELAATERLVEQIQHEREESRRGFSEFLEAMGVSNLREYVAKIAEVPA